MTTVQPRKQHPYYSFDRVESYNGTFNFVCGGRGIGKTYGRKKKAIRAFIKRGEQFIYLRRYKTELTTSRQTFIADVGHEFPDHDFKIHGSTLQIAPASTRDEKKREWHTAAFFVALSTAQTQKSVAFPNVKTIIYDEAIIEQGSNLQYLRNEADVFNNFYNTVDRYQDKTRVWFLANSVSIMNPYFMAYDIVPDQEGRIVVKRDGFIVCDFPDSEEFAKSVYQTNFGKFIAGTEYAEYAVGNTFKDNHESLIDGKPSSAKYLFTLETPRSTFSIWHDLFPDEYYVQEKRPKREDVFTLVAERMTEDKRLMTFHDKPLQYLRSAFRQAKVNFDKPSTRNSFIEVFKR